MRRTLSSVKIVVFLPLFLVFSLQSFAAKKNQCAGQFDRLEVLGVADKDLETKISEALEAYKGADQFFTAIKSVLKERGQIIDTLEQAMIAKQHTILSGPPGNGKTTLPLLIALNMFEESTGEGSYFSIQLNRETSVGETHGQLDFKTLQKTGRQTRFLDEGMIMARMVILDEIFDARIKTQRNLLTPLENRGHADGRRFTPGKIDFTVAATNKYRSDVYLEARNKDPDATYERFLYNILVPGPFEFADAYSEIINAAGKMNVEIPKLSFEDVDKLNALVEHVEIPPHVEQFMTLMLQRFMSKTMALETKEVAEWEQLPDDQKATNPPFRSTKQFSARTIKAAALALKTSIVQSFLRSGGKRPLRASVSDLANLEAAMTLSGPNDDLLEDMLSEESPIYAHKPGERKELEISKTERTLFRETLQELKVGVNSFTAQYGISTLSSQKNQWMNQKQKLQLAYTLAARLERLESRYRSDIPVRTSHLNEEHVGAAYVRTFIIQTLSELLSPADAQKIVDKVRQKLADVRLQEDEKRKQAEEIARLKLEAEEYRMGVETALNDITQFENAEETINRHTEELLNAERAEVKPLTSYKGKVASKVLVSPNQKAAVTIDLEKQAFIRVIHDSKPQVIPFSKFSGIHQIGKLMDPENPGEFSEHIKFIDLLDDKTLIINYQGGTRADHRGFVVIDLESQQKKEFIAFDNETENIRVTDDGGNLIIVDKNLSLFRVDFEAEPSQRVQSLMVSQYLSMVEAVESTDESFLDLIEEINKGEVLDIRLDQGLIHFSTDGLKNFFTYSLESQVLTLVGQRENASGTHFQYLGMSEDGFRYNVVAYNGSYTHIYTFSPYAQQFDAVNGNAAMQSGDYGVFKTAVKIDEPDVFLINHGTSVYTTFARSGTQQTQIPHDIGGTQLGLVPFEGGALMVLRSADGEETQFVQVAYGDPEIRKLVLEGRLLDIDDFGE